MKLKVLFVFVLAISGPCAFANNYIKCQKSIALLSQKFSALKEHTNSRPLDGMESTGTYQYAVDAKVRMENALNTMERHLAEFEQVRNNSYKICQQAVDQMTSQPGGTNKFRSEIQAIEGIQARESMLNQEAGSIYQSYKSVYTDHINTLDSIAISSAGAGK